MKIPITFSHNPSAIAFWIWAKTNEPRHRTLRVSFLPMKGKSTKIKEGNDLLMWIRLLDFLKSKGWPEYGIVWNEERGLVVFNKYLIQDIYNAIQRNQIR